MTLSTDDVIEGLRERVKQADEDGFVELPVDELEEAIEHLEQLLKEVRQSQ